MFLWTTVMYLGTYLADSVKISLFFKYKQTLVYLNEMFFFCYKNPNLNVPGPEEKKNKRTNYMNLTKYCVRTLIQLV